MLIKRKKQQWNSMKNNISVNTNKDQKMHFFQRRKKYSRKKVNKNSKRLEPQAHNSPNNKQNQKPQK